MKTFAIWSALAFAVATPVAVAATSPLLQWREPAYIVAGFAGVVALSALLLQPLLMGGYLPGLRAIQARWLHRWIGVTLAVLVVVHVAGLWITSPPDVLDALLFASPTPFSLWGVIAMWAVFATAAMVPLRRPLRPLHWRIAHAALAVIIVGGTVAHALLIDGTMGAITKWTICAMVIIATAKLLFDRRRSLIAKRRTASTSAR